MADVCMNGKRVALEWFFGGFGRRFPLILNEVHNFVLQVATAAQLSSAFIVKNAINFLEPSQTSQYFGCLPPPVEEFLHNALTKTPAEYIDGNGVFLAAPIDVALHTETEYYLFDVKNRVSQSESVPMI